MHWGHMARSAVRCVFGCLLTLEYYDVFASAWALSPVFFFFLMIRRPPRSTLDRSSAASDVYKRQQWRCSPAVPESAESFCEPRRHLPQVKWSLIRVVHLEEAWCVRVLERDLAPVSYTHLRAHETVLDLVCRLLLEKKKTEQQYISLIISY